MAICSAAADRIILLFRKPPRLEVIEDLKVMTDTLSWTMPTHLLWRGYDH